MTETEKLEEGLEINEGETAGAEMAEPAKQRVPSRSRRSGAGDFAGCRNSLAGAGDAAGAGRRRVCLRWAVDSAGNSSVRNCLQHEIAGDVCGVRGDFADFRRDSFRDSCGSVAGKRMYDTADVFSGAAAVRRFGRSHCGRELWAALDQ